MLDGMRNGKKSSRDIYMISWPVSTYYNMLLKKIKRHSLIVSRWEKYDAKGWTEKGAHKYGRLNEQSWWEKWGEHYDGRGSVLKWLLLILS